MKITLVNLMAAAGLAAAALGAEVLAALPQGPSPSAQRPAKTVLSTPIVLPPSTRLEALLAAPDALTVQDLFRVSDQLTSSLGVSVDALVLTSSAPSASPLKGARLQVRDGDRSERSYLDMDELPALSQALADLMSIASGWTGRAEDRTKDAHFASAGGFVVTLHQDFHGQEASIQAGVLDPVIRPIAPASLSVVKAAIDEALRVLREK